MDRLITSTDRLRRQCQDIDESDDLVDISRCLFDVMSQYEGRGLAANQIGIARRIFVMHRKAGTPICLANPIVTKTKGIQLAKEMCLSLPGLEVLVPRPEMIRVRGINQYRIPVSFKFEGIDARVACHEIDHLNGKLIIDYAGGCV